MHHPDAGGNRARFEQVVTAHRILADPEQRKAYDVYLAQREQEEARELAAQREASQYYSSSQDQVFTEETLYDDSFDHPVRHFLGYLVVLIAILAVILGPAWFALRTSNDEVPAAVGSATPAAAAVEERHNGLDEAQSALRWLVAFQALTGTAPQATPDDAAAVYETSRPGARCDDFTRPQYWTMVAPESQDPSVIQGALNHDFARAIAECNNFDAILPAITGTLIVDTPTLASRFREIERFADEAVFTPGGI